VSPSFFTVGFGDGFGVGLGDGFVVAVGLGAPVVGVVGVGAGAEVSLGVATGPCGAVVDWLGAATGSLVCDPLPPNVIPPHPETRRATATAPVTTPPSRVRVRTMVSPSVVTVSRDETSLLSC
jgi:hypothetical protein